MILLMCDVLCHINIGCFYANKVLKGSIKSQNNAGLLISPSELDSGTIQSPVFLCVMNSIFKVQISIQIPRDTTGWIWTTALIEFHCYNNICIILH